MNQQPDFVIMLRADDERSSGVTHTMLMDAAYKRIVKATHHSTADGIETISVYLHPPKD